METTITCPNCQGYKTMPFAWYGTFAPKMCSCPKTTLLAWECSRCGKINAPWKGSCDCTPSSLSGAPTCIMYAQPQNLYTEKNFNRLNLKSNEN